MKENFLNATDFTFQWEGFKSHIEGDYGGRTVWGFCERFWPEQVKAMLSMSAPVAKAYALQQYKLHFWDLIGGDGLPYPLDEIAFDCAVNPGPSWIKYVLDTTDNWETVISLREEHYRRVAHPNVLKGLLNRCAALREKYQGEPTATE